MAVAVVMPRLSDSMEEGVVVAWHKAVGDSVRSGEPLVDVETDKATMTYEAEADGTVLELLAAEGDAVPLGATIARIGDPGEAAGGEASRNGEAPAASSSQQAPPSGAALPDSATAAAAAPPPRRGGGRALASPQARRHAAAAGHARQGVADRPPTSPRAWH
jgi:pyruvate dehydrogenase E2 component (dihydrolipoamide acetyltransferase)